VLVYIRSYKGDQILCVANLSRFAQAVELDLSAFAGMRPIEMFGYTEFPVVARGPYVLSLNPYGFYWFELQRVSETAESRSAGPTPEVAPLLAGSWRELFESGAGEILENGVLSPFLSSQKWFAGKGKTIESVRILDWARLSTLSVPSALVLVRVRYTAGEPETYFIPLSIVSADHGESAPATPDKVLCGIEWNGTNGLLYDGIAADETCSGLFQAIASTGEIYARRGLLRSAPSLTFDSFRHFATDGLKLSRGGGEHNAASVFLGEKLVMKVYRKVDSGVNPEPEVLRYLSEDARFEHVPLYLGTLEYVPFEGEAQTLAVLESKVDDQGNGWDWMVQDVGRYYESCTELRLSAETNASIGLSLEAALTLGHRTAEMHLALARNTDPAFAAEPFSRHDLAAVVEGIRREAAASFDLLRQNLARLPEDVAAEADRLLRRPDELSALLERVESADIRASKTRVHGNYHLGQVLRVKNDYVIIDFEGEPRRSLSERRAKTSPLKDVASMLRSFNYASHTALFTYMSRRPEQAGGAHCATLWEEEMSTVFLESYRQATEGSTLVPADADAFMTLLNIFVLERAIYEIREELNTPPSRVRVPLRAIADVLDSDKGQ
jgi:maltose alpha-D-glucosyltransferase / alpha-amylase